MFVSNITPVIILANVAGIDAELRAALIQNCMIIASIGTLIQLYPVWRVGSRLPIVMGISFTFLSLAISISVSHGMGSLIGAVIVGGIVEGCLGLFPKYWTKLISPIVAATVVTAIGFSLLPVGANSFAGGQGAADFGSMPNWIVGTITLLTCLIVMVFGRGLLRSLSVLVGLIVGYVVSLFLGIVDLSVLNGLQAISLPTLMPFTPEFHIDTILALVCVYLVSATETIGDTSALCSGALSRKPTTRELGGSVACDGFVSIVAGLFGCTPITSFSQNVGLATISKVVNRFAIATGAIIMMMAGFFPIIVRTLASRAWRLHTDDVWRHLVCRIRNDGKMRILQPQYDYREHIAQRWPRIHPSHWHVCHIPRHRANDFRRELCSRGVCDSRDSQPASPQRGEMRIMP